ncbi:S8 family peptidase [Paenibacillus ehimensis]|uniref:S8 family peptidase n=1 Tax=Paenibacillus ehimensis TaxID=79264 RepID=UPI0004703822|nr:S8/S53 family peptidase [Paenibacillus ehimensis]MEC0212515.1 S8/S53 family peptidase [Paenibacillus ehimensis]
MSELKKVLVEMRKTDANIVAMKSNDTLEEVGFKFDTTFSPVEMRMPPSRSEALSTAENQQQTVVVRGTIPEDKIKELESQPNVVKVYTDAKISLFSTPTTDCNPTTPHGNKADVARYLGVNHLWQDNIKGQGIVVAVCDGGITAEGRPVKPGETARRIPRVIGGFPEDWGTEASAGREHGNMCATDVLAMAPEAQLYDLRIFKGGIESTLSEALQAYEWVIQQHRQNGTPHVISNSWGIYQESWGEDYANDPNHIFTRKVVEAINEGIIVLFAAGNCGGNCTPNSRCGTDVGPGRSIWGANGHPLVITVGAVNIDEQIVGYSSQGPASLDPRKPDFCSITHFTGYYNSDNGTSAATPIAAGAVALLKQADGSLNQQQIKKLLNETAKDIDGQGWNATTGWGVIQPKKAYEKIASQAAVPV